LNKKYAIVSIVLIALMSLSLIPATAFAHHTPSSTDDSVYDPYGPRASQILVKIYTDYTAELAGFINKEVDMMDWGLEPIDYQYFETTDPNHAQYSTAFYAEFGLYEYDINDQVLPTSIISVRQAFSHMLDKDFFINTYMSGTAIKADSPIASIPGWYNPAITDLYNLAPRTTWPIPDDTADWQAALTLLFQDLGTPITDPENPAYLTWTWPSPFPDPDPTGAFPPVADGHLLVFARNEMAPRAQQGVYFKDACETALPAMGVALGFGPVRLHVDLYTVPRSTTSPQVMGYYRYHVYTGGWSMGRDPDFLQFYTTALIAKPAAYGNNYLMYSNPAYDDEVNLMLTSAIIGVPGNPCDGKYHAYLAQQILMNDAGLIPFWTFSGYKAYLSNWQGVVNQIGFGANGWWSFLNMHKVGSAGSDLIRYGFAGDVLSLNVMSAQWLWDWDIMGRVYDALIAVNPYNMGQDLPYLTTGWNISTWLYGGTDVATKITFNLREDVFWQDMPANPTRSDITFDNGPWLNNAATNMPLTPIDVAFSIEYIRDLLDSWNGWLMAPVDHVGLNLDMWGSLWTSPVSGQSYTVAQPEWYTADVDYGIPWQTDFIQNEALGTEQITVYLNVFMPWLALHWVGGIPITPYHIWRYIQQNVGLNVDSWQYDILYGTGPDILLSRTAGVDMTMIPFLAGNSYRGITLQNSFFYQVIRPTEDEYDAEGINGRNVYFINALHNYGTSAIDVTVYFDYNIWMYNSGAGTWGPLTPALSGVTASQVITIQPGQTARIVNPKVVQIPVVPFGTWFVIHDSMHWAYTAFDHAWTGYYGDFSGHTPEEPAYWSDLVLYHPGDHFGRTPAPVAGGAWDQLNEYSERYLAANGLVNIGDVGPITAHWQQAAPTTYDIGINDNNGITKRADMDGNNVVAVGDVGLITANWQKTWTDTPPAFPTVGP
jgi:hypothetical protein